MRGLRIQKNIPVPDTKLTLGLSVGLLSSHLAADKIFIVELRANMGPDEPLALGKKHAFIIPWLILVVRTDDLGYYIMSNYQGHMLFQHLNRIASRPNVKPGQILYCTTNSIPIDLKLQESFHTYTQVWNSLSHRNDRRQRRMI